MEAIQKRLSIITFSSLYFIFFLLLFFIYEGTHLNISNGDFILDFDLTPFSIFVAIIYCLSFALSLFPTKEHENLRPQFLALFFLGLGIIFSNTIFTFFVFWSLHRLIPFIHFLKNFGQDSGRKAGSYILAHLLGFALFSYLVFQSYEMNLLTTSLRNYPIDFFTLPHLIILIFISFMSQGIFPLHQWGTDLISSFSWQEVSTFLISRSGIILFYKMIIPGLSSRPISFQLAIMIITIISSIYWISMAMIEKNIHKAIGMFYLSQASLIITGLQAGPVGVKGALIQMVVISFASTTMWSITHYLDREFKLNSQTSFHGLARYTPRLAFVFIMMAFSVIALPLGLGFASEDLLVHALLEHAHWLGLFHILAACLNGIFIYQLFGKIFLGTPKNDIPQANFDLPYRRLIPYYLIIVFFLGTGLFPQWIIGILP